MNAAPLDYRTLSRIVEMLMALAVLAERAGSRSLPVRFLVLFILRRVETVAHAFVVDAVRMDWPFDEEILAVDNGPADAIWLAWRFRVLAAALSALLRMVSCLDSRNAIFDRAPRRLVTHSRLVASDAWGAKLHDTS